MLVLLDRDGVLNEDRPDSVRAPEQFILLPRAGEAVALLNRAGMNIAIVTNQSAVGRGEISMEMLLVIHAKLIRELRAHGAVIDDIFVCTDTAERPTYRRKPKPGMLVEAMRKYGALPERTPMVGDDVRDLEAAHAAGCPRYLVRTGKGANVFAKGFASSLQPVEICEDVLDAARRIVATFRP